MTDKNWHSVALEVVTRELGANIDKGLSEDEVAKRKIIYGSNLLPRGKKVHWWQVLFRQFTSPLILILLVAAVITFFLGETIDTVVILMAVTVNTAISFWQEFRSNNIFEKLQKLVALSTKVKRNGVMSDMNSEALVPGDIIFLHPGDKVPADARLFFAEDLEVNEALLTGESVPVKK